MTDASNSSEPALKSHKAAADAQRVAEARKAAELKAQAAQRAADSAADSAGTIAPLGLPPISLSRSSSQVMPSRNTSPGIRSVSPDDEPEECVRPPKGKRKAATGMLTHFHTIQSLINVLILVNTDTEPSTDSGSLEQQKKKRMYITLLSSACNNSIFQPRNAVRKGLVLAPPCQAKMVFSQTSNLLESQVDRRRGARMQAATFESFSMTAILPQKLMGKQSSTGIARYARTPPRYFLSWIRVI